jgi:hypothetical protein
MAIITPQTRIEVENTVSGKVDAVCLLLFWALFC